MKKTNKIKTEEYHRSISLRFDSVQADTRTVPAAISSEKVVARWFGTEKLVHSDKSINMERANDGLPLLFNHSGDKPIGRVDNIRLVDGLLRGDLTFSENPLANQVFKDVEGEFLRDVSIGYRIEKYKDVKGGIEATRWQPYEVSIVSIPADNTVGVNRNLHSEDDEMDNDEKKEKGISTKVGAEHSLGIREGMRIEQERASDIRAIFFNFMDNEKAVSTMERCLSDSTVSVDMARSELLDLLGNGYKPTAKSGKTDVAGQVGDEDTEKFYRAASDAIAVRFGIETDKKVIAEVRSSDLATSTLFELAKDSLVKKGYSIRGLDKMGIVGEAFLRGAHSTSDFPALMANVANKSMAKGFDEAPTTWNIWADTMSVPDFKDANIVALSEFSDLELLPEGAEIKHGTFKDKSEKIGLDTYAKGFGITRNAIINDDMQALSKIPYKMGQKASLSIENLAYGTLTSNPLLNEDGKTVFHADHHNIGTAGALDYPAIDEMLLLMATQSGLLKTAGKTKNKASTTMLDIPGKYLVVPKSMESLAKQLMQADYASDDRSKPNVWKGILQVVASAKVPGGYYILADQAMFDTVRLAFLDGIQTPFLETQQGWTTYGVEYRVRIDVGAAWTDFRAATYNAGA